MEYVYLASMIVSGIVGTVGLWIGVFALRGARQGVAWWLMLLGLIVALLGCGAYGASIGSFLKDFSSRTAAAASAPPVVTSGGATMVTVTPTPGRSPGMPSQGALMMMVVSSIAMFVGVVLFNVGFALSGFVTARLAKRAAELEMLCSSMSEEMRQRG